MQEIATFSVGLNSEHSKCSKKYAAFLVKNASRTYIKKTSKDYRELRNFSGLTDKKTESRSVWENQYTFYNNIVSYKQSK